ncbi:MAG: hypothetical protein MUC92_07580 [Fimbriimonadaceae bacterium]|nr:hypothetical protein [Fimbriimonadaceae bacterium]
MRYPPDTTTIQNVMGQEERIVVVRLTVDEAYEILDACLNSSNQDTILFQRALRRLARAIESQAETTQRQAA